MRLQILLDDARYRRITAATAGAQDLCLSSRPRGHRWGRLTSRGNGPPPTRSLPAEPVRVPATVEELKRELDEIRSGAHSSSIRHERAYQAGAESTPARTLRSDSSLRWATGAWAATTTSDVMQEFAHVYSRRHSRGRTQFDTHSTTQCSSAHRSDDLRTIRRGLTLFEQHEELGSADAALTQPLRRTRRGISLLRRIARS